ARDAPSTPTEGCSVKSAMIRASRSSILVDCVVVMVILSSLSGATGNIVFTLRSPLLSRCIVAGGGATLGGMSDSAVELTPQEREANLDSATLAQLVGLVDYDETADPFPVTGWDAITFVVG